MDGVVPLLPATRAVCWYCVGLQVVDFLQFTSSLLFCRFFVITPSPIAGRGIVVIHLEAALDNRLDPPDDLPLAPRF